jgi:hypothetical protein
MARYNRGKELNRRSHFGSCSRWSENELDFERTTMKRARVLKPPFNCAAKKQHYIEQHIDLGTVDISG